MKRDELAFERPEHLFAELPPESRGGSRDDVRLLVTDRDGNHHLPFGEFPGLLGSDDLVVVNESAAIRASLPATGTSGSFLLNLSTR